MKYGKTVERYGSSELKRKNELEDQDEKEPSSSKQEEELEDLKSITPSNIIISGQISGAHFKIAEPEQWSGSLLIYAHGYRPKGHGLQVELDLSEGSCYKLLINEGWIVAATSYRREGVILADSMLDVVNLKRFVEQRYGAAREVIVEGQSMGGAVATLLAENQQKNIQQQRRGISRSNMNNVSKPEISGVLAVGAALMWRKDTITEEEKAIAFTHTPLIPILYLTNYTELGPINQYVESCKMKRKGNQDLMDFPVPAVWKVYRSGHNWTNNQERYQAVRSLCRWIKFGTCITMRLKDGTVPISKRASSATFDKKQLKATGYIEDIKASGVIVTSFVGEDLAKLGLRLGSSFEADVNSCKLQGVVFDEYPYVRAERGRWLAILEPEQGRVVLGILDCVSKHSPADLAGRARKGDAVIFFSNDKKPRRLLTDKIRKMEQLCSGGHEQKKNKSKSGEEQTNVPTVVPPPPLFGTKASLKSDVGST